MAAETGFTPSEPVRALYTLKAVTLPSISAVPGSEAGDKKASPAGQP
jgi:hypothetical protein